MQKVWIEKTKKKDINGDNFMKSTSKKRSYVTILVPCDRSLFVEYGTHFMSNY